MSASGCQSRSSTTTTGRSQCILTSRRLERQIQIQVSLIPLLQALNKITLVALYLHMLTTLVVSISRPVGRGYPGGPEPHCMVPRRLMCSGFLQQKKFGSGHEENTPVERRTANAEDTDSLRCASHSDGRCCVCGNVDYATPFYISLEPCERARALFTGTRMGADHLGLASLGASQGMGRRSSINRFLRSYNASGSE